LNELPIQIELQAAPGVAIQDGTEQAHNEVMRDPIVAALAQLVRDAYANEQRMRTRLHVVGPSGEEAESMAAQDECLPDESAQEPEPERRKTA
jgi:predicted XRE-type DNA-binding protein